MNLEGDDRNCLETKRDMGGGRLLEYFQDAVMFGLSVV